MSRHRGVVYTDTPTVNTLPFPSLQPKHFLWLFHVPYLVAAPAHTGTVASSWFCYDLTFMLRILSAIPEWELALSCEMTGDFQFYDFLNA